LLSSSGGDRAAKRRISVNPHEPVKDTGLHRTARTWSPREGARGMEFSVWGPPGNPPEHEANLVFTRLLAGPMDYTPGVFGMQTRSSGGIETTWAKQLALYVVIHSPPQMAADLLDHYEANPGPFQFIKDMPVDWETTRVLNGEVGDYVTIVRTSAAATTGTRVRSRTNTRAASTWRCRSSTMAAATPPRSTATPTTRTIATTARTS
jgi:alpha-glucosidase